MATYVLRRLIQAIPILIGISIISFLIVHLAPAIPWIDSARAACRRRRSRTSSGCTASTSRCWNSSSAGSRPSGRSRGTPAAWGYSFVDGRPVTEKIFEKIPPDARAHGHRAHRHDDRRRSRSASWPRSSSTAGRTRSSPRSRRSATPCRRSCWASCCCTSSSIRLNLFPLFGRQSLGQDGDFGRPRSGTSSCP